MPKYFTAQKPYMMPYIENANLSTTAPHIVKYVNCKTWRNILQTYQDVTTDLKLSTARP
jgi:hypothetical protein